MKRVIKTLGRIVGILLIVIAVILVLLIIKGKIDERRPYLTDNYYEDFISESSLEMKYSQRGGFETEYAEFDSDNKNIKTIRVWYPKELESTSKTYPMIIIVNASGTRALNYKPYFDR